MIAIHSPLQAQLVSWQVEAGASVRAGEPLVILEAMKMEHEVRASASGVVSGRFGQPGEMVDEGQLLAHIAPAPADAAAFAGQPDTRGPGAQAPAGAIRADLRRLRERERFLHDDSRAQVMDKRHALGMRSARENIDDLCDAGSFSEYGALAVAAQRARRSADDLMRNTPADGMVTGIGSINAAQFGRQRSSAVVMAYDATVLAGTQGMRNHQKTDRMLGIALENRLPVVLFAEGGGGRPA